MGLKEIKNLRNNSNNLGYIILTFNNLSPCFWETDFIEVNFYERVSFIISINYK